MKDFFEIRKIISILSWTTILLSFILIVYALQYNVLIDHDYVMSYGYSFMHPEHGRYLSTFMINFLIERVPYFFNIHPNIIEKLVIAPIKAVIIILFCLFFANAFFLAKKGKKNPLSFEFSNIVFIITYVIIFLSLFNCNYFFINEWSYFMTQQTTKFFDYPFNLLWWVILFNFLSFYIINPNLLLKKSILLIIKLV